MQVSKSVFGLLILIVLFTTRCAEEINETKQNAERPVVVFPELLKDSLLTEYKEFEKLESDSLKLHYLLDLTYTRPFLKIPLLSHIIKQKFDSLTLGYKLEAYTRLGRFYNRRLKDTAIFCFNKGIAEASKSKLYFKELAMLYREKGSFFINRSKYADGIVCYNQAIHYSEMANCKDSYITFISEMGNAYMQMNDTRKALECYLKGKAYSEKRKDYNLMLYSLNSLGDLCRILGNLDTAIYFHQQAIEINTRFINGKEEPWACTSLGKVYTLKKEFDAAEKYFGIVLTNANQNSDTSLIIQSLLQLSRCDAERGWIKKAIDRATLAYEITKKRPDISMKFSAADRLARLYEKDKQFENVIHFLKLLHFYRDTLENNEQVKKIANAEFHEKESALLEKIEKNNQLLKMEEEKRLLERKRLRTIIVSITLGLIMISVFAFLIFRSLQRNKKQNMIIGLQKQHIEEQKRTVEEKNKEVMDSIQYARRIQQALLPSEKLIDKKLGILRLRDSGFKKKEN